MDPILPFDPMRGRARAVYRAPVALLLGVSILDYYSIRCKHVWDLSWSIFVVC